MKGQEYHIYRPPGLCMAFLLVALCVCCLSATVDRGAAGENDACMRCCLFRMDGLNNVDGKVGWTIFRTVSST